MGKASIETNGGAGLDGVPAAQYRELMSAFPTGVAVITAFDPAGRPHGMTCTSLASVTTTPPVLLACLDARSGTLGSLLATGAFGVNLLHARGREVAVLFSAGAGDRFAQREWQRSSLLGVPHLTDDAFATAECELSGTATMGDHVVVFGRVVTVRQVQDVPLLYGLRRFSHWNPKPTGAPA